jgi:hypothetical protein
MYQNQQGSTGLCIDFYLLSTQDSSCGRNCLRSKIVDLCTGGAINSVPCVALGYTNPYAVPAGYVLLIPYLSVLSLLYIAGPADVVFGTASFQQRRRHFTVQ